ncbi:MAG: hypothetical protein ABJE47_17540 [bacterium]
MRIPFVVAACSLLVLPDVMAAQRAAPVPGSRRPVPAQPVPLSPQPGPIARASAYQRSRVSIETYPIASYVSAPSFSPVGGVAQWASLGTGTRAEYRSSSVISATLDMTTSLLGGPASTQTVEAGARYRPIAWDHALRPYADLRAAYMRAGGAYSLPINDQVPFGTQPLAVNGMQYSSGFGGVAGAGMEYWFARNFAVTSGLSMLRSQMTTYRYTGTSFPTDGRYMMTTYRLTLGLRFNPVLAPQLR